MLNSLQMGFKTLAIQKRSSEVWQILGAVKTEFGKFGGVLEKAQKKITFTELLSDCNIGLSTVMLEKKLIDNNCQFPILKTKEDFVLWLKISKKTDLYGMDIPLVKWRKLSNSLSSNSFQKLIDGFKVYNRYMKFSLIKSCSIFYIFGADLGLFIFF